MNPDQQIMQAFWGRRPGHAHCFTKSDVEVGIWIEFVVLQLRLLREATESGRGGDACVVRTVLAEHLNDRPTQKRFREFALSFLAESLREASASRGGERADAGA